MKKYSMETVVGIFVVIGLLCVGYMTVKLGKLTFLSDSTYTVLARFANVAGLRPGTEVDVYGIKVGTIETLTIDQKRQMALVTMKVDRKVELFDDASATIKSSGLIGDKYIKLEPGGSGALLKPGGVITDTNAPADIEDLIGKYAFGDVKKSPDTKTDKGDVK